MYEFDGSSIVRAGKGLALPPPDDDLDASLQAAGYTQQVRMGVECSAEVEVWAQSDDTEARDGAHYQFVCVVSLGCDCSYIILVRDLPMLMNSLHMWNRCCRCHCTDVIENG